MDVGDASRRLASERHRVEKRLALLVDAISTIAESTDFVASDDEHDPEGTTLSLERAQLAALVSDAEQQKAELDHAIRKLSRDTYGICEDCAESIAVERLRVRPAARLCVACASRGAGR